jgi:hypothetical protein
MLQRGRYADTSIPRVRLLIWRISRLLQHPRSLLRNRQRSPNRHSHNRRSAHPKPPYHLADVYVLVSHIPRHTLHPHILPSLSPLRALRFAYRTVHMLSLSSPDILLLQHPSTHWRARLAVWTGRQSRIPSLLPVYRPMVRQAQRPCVRYMVQRRWSRRRRNTTRSRSTAQQRRIQNNNAHHFRDFLRPRGAVGILHQATRPARSYAKEETVPFPVSEEQVLPHAPSSQHHPGMWILPPQHLPTGVCPGPIRCFNVPVHADSHAVQPRCDSRPSRHGRSNRPIRLYCVYTHLSSWVSSLSVLTLGSVYISARGVCVLLRLRVVRGMLAIGLASRHSRNLSAGREPWMGLRRSDDDVRLAVCGQGSRKSDCWTAQPGTSQRHAIAGTSFCELWKRIWCVDYLHWGGCDPEQFRRLVGKISSSLNVKGRFDCNSSIRTFTSTSHETDFHSIQPPTLSIYPHNNSPAQTNTN